MSASTKRALADSLKKLLAKKTLDKITVRDITDDCNVNRQTFYYHFHDVYDLVEWILTEEVALYISDGLTKENWKDVMRRMMDEMSKERSFMTNVYYSLSRRELDRFLQKISRPILEEITDRACEGKNISDEDKSYIVELFTYALCGIVTEWIASGMLDSLGMKIEKMFTIMDGILVYTIDKFVK